jgi:predicted membrane protein
MENNVKQTNRNGLPKGLLVGILLMLVGMVILGTNLGMIPSPLRHILISWQMLLIIIGIGDYLKNKPFSGTILIMIGSFFLMPRIIENYPALFPSINANFTQMYWPLLLVMAGIFIILSKLLGSKFDWPIWEKEHHRAMHREHCRNKGYCTGSENLGFSKNSIFGSGDHIVLDPEFKGGEMNAVFGGITLDLRRTSLPEGDTCLEINAVFGGITIYIPTDWNVETHMDAVFGGFQDNRLPKEPMDKTRKLIIKGSCVFGGGELRN